MFKRFRVSKIFFQGLIIVIRKNVLNWLKVKVKNTFCTEIQDSNKYFSFELNIIKESKKIYIMASTKILCCTTVFDIDNKMKCSWTPNHQQVYKALGFHQKYLNLCSEDERRSYGFGTTWGWVINDKILIFWVNYPFNRNVVPRPTNICPTLVNHFYGHTICVNVLFCSRKVSLSHTHTLWCSTVPDKRVAPRAIRAVEQHVLQGQREG